MRRRTAVILATVSAALALAAGNYPALSANPTDEDCRDAWAASGAYNTCGDRSNAWGPTAENVSAPGGRCVIETYCVYHYLEGGATVEARRYTSWEGGAQNAAWLQNCDGWLEITC